LRCPGGGSTVGGVLSVGSPAGKVTMLPDGAPEAGSTESRPADACGRLNVTMLPASCPCARAAGAASDNAAATSTAASGRAALPI
jgi:hypothetical protein